jgi:HK97 family phage major capsid protein
MKELIEKRNAMLDELDSILSKAKEEKRAFDETELKKVTDLKEEIRKIDESIKLEEEVRGLEKKEIKKPEVRSAEEIRAEVITKEERAFVDFVRGLQTEQRATLSAGSQGVVIPQTIANRIIDQVKNLSPILSKATIWEVSGDLIVPSYDYTQHVPAGYYTELATLTAQAANFGSIKLGNTIIATLALISKSLVSRTDVDIVPFIVNEIAKAIAFFLEKELLNNANSSVGSGATKLGGLANATQVINGATTLVIDTAELVKMQLTLPQVFQGNAEWYMHPQTLAYIQSLKSTTGKFLMGNTLSEDGKYDLLGRPVNVSDNMPVIGVGANEIFYGDMTGLHIKITNGLQIQVLNERFADQYAIGVVAVIEADSCIVEQQKVVKYVGK